MKKIMISLLLGLSLILSLSMPVWAELRNGVYIIDEKDYLTASEYSFFQIQAAELSDSLDMDILYVLTNDLDLDTMAQSLNLGSRPNQIMLISNELEQKVLLFGTAMALTEEDKQILVEAYTLQPTYIDGIRAYLEAADTLVTEKKQLGAFDPQPEVKPQAHSRLVDRANLLNASQIVYLRQLLDEISLRQQLDVVVVTVHGLDGKTPMDYADDFFDNNGYGFGPNYDGILLLVSMEQRDWWISTSGYGITAFTDAGLDYISDHVVPKLSKGQYGKAFEIFAEKCDVFITQARTGEPFDVDHMPKEPFPFGLCLIISIVVGLVAAGIVCWYLEKQLKTVVSQSGAAEYSTLNVPQLIQNKEIYLYSTMSSSPKLKLEDFQDHSDSGRIRGGGSLGGSRTHRSSSGRFHGGRGGKF